jgi:hypothetical protein
LEGLPAVVECCSGFGEGDTTNPGGTCQSARLRFDVHDTALYATPRRANPWGIGWNRRLTRNLNIATAINLSGKNEYFGFPPCPNVGNLWRLEINPHEMTRPSAVWTNTGRLIALPIPAFLDNALLFRHETASAIGHLRVFEKALSAHKTCVLEWAIVTAHIDSFQANIPPEAVIRGFTIFSFVAWAERAKAQACE